MTRADPNPLVALMKQLESDIVDDRSLPAGQAATARLFHVETVRNLASNRIKQFRAGERATPDGQRFIIGWAIKQVRLYNETLKIPVPSEIIDLLERCAMPPEDIDWQQLRGAAKRQHAILYLAQRPELEINNHNVRKAFSSVGEEFSGAHQYGKNRLSHRIAKRWLGRPKLCVRNRATALGYGLKLARTLLGT